MELVDRVEAYEYLERTSNRLEINGEYSKGLRSGLDFAIRHIKYIPSVDLDSANGFGDWITDDWIWECSKCNETYHRDDARKYKYCPNCGVKIKGIIHWEDKDECR